MTAVVYFSELTKSQLKAIIIFQQMSLQSEAQSNRIVSSLIQSFSATQTLFNKKVLNPSPDIKTKYMIQNGQILLLKSSPSQQLEMLLKGMQKQKDLALGGNFDDIMRNLVGGFPPEDEDWEEDEDMGMDDRFDGLIGYPSQNDVMRMRDDDEDPDDLDQRAYDRLMEQYFSSGGLAQDGAEVNMESVWDRAEVGYFGRDREEEDRDDDNRDNDHNDDNDGGANNQDGDGDNDWVDDNDDGGEDEKN